MGGHVSKNNTPRTSSGFNLNANNMATDLISFEAARKLDSDLQSFDATLQTLTKVLNTIAVGRSLSLNSLCQATECLLDMNQNVAEVIQDCLQDIRNEKELSELVEEYFDNSLDTLKLYNALKKCLQRARNSQLPVLQALQHFDEDTEKVGNSRYARTLKGLKNFRAAGDPFTEEFFKKFQSVYDQQKLMLDKLKRRKNKLDKKLKYTHTWRKVWSVIYVVTTAAAFICSVVAGAFGLPQVVAALAAAVAEIPTGPVEKWLEKVENALKGQKMETDSTHTNTHAAIKELDDIWILIDGLKDQIELLMENVDYAIEQEAVKVAVEEIKKQMEDFKKGVENLGDQADKCSRNVMAARKEVLQIIKMQN